MPSSPARHYTTYLSFRPELAAAGKNMRSIRRKYSGETGLFDTRKRDLKQVSRAHGERELVENPMGNRLYGGCEVSNFTGLLYEVLYKDNNKNEADTFKLKLILKLNPDKRIMDAAPRDLVF